MDNTNKYQCTLKVFDDSLSPEKAEPMTVTVFGKSAGDVPHVTKVGSIIRLHRVQTSKYRKSYQINCDVGIKGAWLLFDPAIGVSPISESGKKHTFSPEEKSILSELRKFAKNYFTKNALKAITLKDAEKKHKDFDTICYVEDVKKKGASGKATVSDAHKTVKLDFSSNTKLPVAPEEVIRIRSANYTDKKCDTINLNEYSNILKLDQDYKSAKDLLKKLKK
eukprot:TRINITY_DN5415_c0_g1_i10.p1 TRINITY_DN5415_c0_g1~~TRINITY_DN5415_c0_g1_i10.p1  ORF type:complete len:222 (-),score=92.98 TRINITY_DN5415_c0_g1_i10:210-875(-)